MPDGSLNIGDSRRIWNSSFKVNPNTKGLKRTSFKSRTSPLKRSGTLRKIRPSEVQTPSERAKTGIQALLRRFCIVRDGGCFLRSKEAIAGKCGGYNKAGELILQFDHLNSRTHAVSFADPRLGICACQRHHIFWKPQEPDLYMKLAREFIGPQRSVLLDAVQADRSPHKKDWVLEELALKRALAKLESVVN